MNNFLSGSGEQEEMPNNASGGNSQNYMQNQFSVGGSAAGAAGGGSAANEAAINSSHGFGIHQHMMGSGGQSQSAS